MKLRDFGILTDQNLHPEVVAFLRSEGFNVLDVREQGVLGTEDLILLQRSVVENRLIFTHDSDFGTLAIRQGEQVVGIVYIRPGHIRPQFTIDTIQAILTDDPDVCPPFILVAKRSGTKVSLRVRQIM